MLRIIAILFGIVFIFAGVAGFLPRFTTDDMLFGYFHVDMIHNIIHLVIGVIAIMGATSHDGARLFFKAIGIIFTVAGILGFWQAGDLYIIHVNTADNILHLVAGIFALYLGFASRKETA